MSELPKLDKRNSDDLLNEVKFLASQYTPEWNFDSKSSDFGVVFAKTFCKMMEGTINRYNKTVYNYYLTFLNMLGTQLRPSSPSSGMIVVKSSENNTNGVYIRKAVRLFASADTEDGMVIYETIDPLTVINTDIEKVYITDGKKDFISDVYTNSGSKGDKLNSFRIFDSVLNENIQTHEIYFDDPIIFDMSKTDIIFSFNNSISEKTQSYLPKIFSDSENISWEYNSGGKWIKIEDVKVTEDSGVRIKFEGTSDITQVNNKESRFIRCKFKKIPKEEISITSVYYYSVSSPLKADNFICNDQELENKDFFPFEEKYNMYNSFYIKCDEALNKKGSTVKLKVNLQFVKIETDAKLPRNSYKSVMNESDFANLKPEDIKIEAVKWEYWNGSGWSILKTSSESEKFFNVNAEEKNEVNREMTFICPEDIKTFSVGPASGYFIRAKISKMNDRFDYYANYITPYIHDVLIEYSYGENKSKCENVIVNSNLEIKNINFSDKSVVTLLNKNLSNCPCMYFCLSKPLVQGIVRLFVDIEEGIHRFNPPIKWEYLAKDTKGGKKWKHIDIMDETDEFAHSGIVTLIGKNDYEKSTIFGKEGYFIRISNPDEKYSQENSIESRPIINDIKFNAVKIIQKDTRPEEYFSIATNEKNKVCKLSNLNVANAEVWVDEINEVSVQEQEDLLKNCLNKTEAEYDELGKLIHLWIKWEPVQNLVSCTMTQRVYEIDYPKGKIIFGDGKNGKIPPEQYSESIKVKYSICNGSKGNVKPNEVKDFVGTILNIESVTNPSSVIGGVDMETIDAAASRVFSQISGGNRLVSLSDFEESICFNDRNIYSVKCASHVNEDGEECIGATSIAVLPRMYMQGYEKFQSIKNKIWDFIDKKAPATLAKSTRLGIFEVGYVETSVNVDVVVDDFNHYQGVYSGIELRLEKFLDPIEGNFSGKGWKIGEFPRKELIYNYIKTVPNIKWIKSINIFTNLITPEGKKEIDFKEIKKKKFVVPVFGTSDINVSVE